MPLSGVIIRSPQFLDRTLSPGHHNPRSGTKAGQDLILMVTGSPAVVYFNSIETDQQVQAVA